MKKSEVEKIISDTIDANTQETKDELATIILYELEQLGMLPPCRADFGGHGKKLQYNVGCDDYIESCDFTWEPE
jgi:hypothetical protein